MAALRISGCARIIVRPRIRVVDATDRRKPTRARGRPRTWVVRGRGPGRRAVEGSAPTRPSTRETRELRKTRDGTRIVRPTGRESPTGFEKRGTWIVRGRVAATPRRRPGYSVDGPPASLRSAAAAALYAAVATPTCAGAPTVAAALGIVRDGSFAAAVSASVLTLAVYLGPLAVSALSFVVAADARPGNRSEQWRAELADDWDLRRTRLEQPGAVEVDLRNLLVGPLSEEVVFRACMLPLLLEAGWSRGRACVLSPLFFGVAHLHHLKRRVADEGVPVRDALLSTAFQFAYTTLFGVYTAFVYRGRVETSTRRGPSRRNSSDRGRRPRPNAVRASTNAQRCKSEHERAASSAPAQVRADWQAVRRVRVPRGLQLHGPAGFVVPRGVGRAAVARSTGALRPRRAPRAVGVFVGATRRRDRLVLGPPRPADVARVLREPALVGGRRGGKIGVSAKYPRRGRGAAANLSPRNIRSRDSLAATRSPVGSVRPAPPGDVGGKRHTPRPVVLLARIGLGLRPGRRRYVARRDP